MYEIKPDDEGFTLPVQLQYAVKKDTPVTIPQKKYLQALISYHGLSADVNMEELTKSKASKIIDGIISEYGKIPYRR